jgi:hypothetical protein
MDITPREFLKKKIPMDLFLRPGRWIRSGFSREKKGERHGRAAAKL